MKVINNIHLNEFSTDFVKDKLELKLIEALFSILYKKDLINKKEYNLLIAHLNHKLQDISE